MSGSAEASVDSKKSDDKPALQYSWNRVWKLMDIAKEQVQWDTKRYSSLRCIPKFWPILGPMLLDKDLVDLWLQIQEQMDFNRRIDTITAHAQKSVPSPYSRQDVNKTNAE